MIANVDNHMAIHHQEQSVDQPNILDSSDANTVEVVDDDATTIEEVVAAVDITPPNVFSVGDIVLVQRKTIYWPAKIESIAGDTYEVVIFDRARTKDKKNIKYIVAFSSDQSICEGRSNLWIKAWKEAKLEFESK